MNTIDKKGWEKVMFGEVCSNLNVATQDPNAMGIDRYVGLEHIETGNLRITSWGNVADGTTFTKTFKPGHVLFGKRRAYLKKAAVADFKGLCSSDILVLEADEKMIEKRLLPFLISSDRFFEYAIQTSAGSLSPRTKFQDLAKFEFLLPPQGNQLRLVELLWAANEVIENYKKLEQSLLSVKNSTVINKIAEYKLNYQDIKLKEVADVIGGYAFKSEEFTSNPIGKGVRQVLKIANITANGLDIKKVPSFIADKGFDAKFLFSYFDIVTSLTGTNGKRDYGFAVINETNEKYWVNQRLAIIRTNNDKIVSKFLYYLMKESVFMDQFFMNAIGTANQANVSTKDMLNIHLPIPTISEQKKLIHSLEAIDNSIKTVKLNILNALAIQKQLINSIFGI